MGKEYAARNARHARDGADGVLELAIGDLTVSLVPTNIKQAASGFVAGIAISDDGNVIFTTDDGREIESQPAVNDLISLDDALSGAALSFSVDDGGAININQVGLPDSSYAMRPSITTSAADTGSVEGIRLISNALLANVATVVLVYADNGSLMQQDLHSTPADWEGMQGLIAGIAGVDSVALGLDGVITISLGGNDYRGVMSYQLEPAAGSTGTTTVSATADSNGDGIGDFVFVYPNGLQQIMYFIPPQ
jgi:hypothetical protein